MRTKWSEEWLDKGGRAAMHLGRQWFIAVSWGAASGTGGGPGEWVEEILSSLAFCKHISYHQSLLFMYVCVPRKVGPLVVISWLRILDGVCKPSVLLIKAKQYFLKTVSVFVFMPWFPKCQIAHQPASSVCSFELTSLQVGIMNNGVVCLSGESCYWWCVTWTGSHGARYIVVKGRE